MTASEPTGAEKRRSPRTPRTVSIIATWVRGQTLTLREQGETEVVNDHGALIKLSSELRVGQQIRLLRPGTQLASRARVVAIRGMGSDGKMRVGIELEALNPGLWQDTGAQTATESITFDL